MSTAAAKKIAPKKSPLKKVGGQQLAIGEPAVMKVVGRTAPVNIKDLKSNLKLVTPDIAVDMLKENSCNRNLTPNWVKELARRMSFNIWQYDASPLKFTASGSLLDGQHRLSAIIMSGIPQYCLVAIGIEREAFHVMDSGRSRSGADILSIDGAENTNILAAAIRRILIHQYGENGRHVSRKGISNSEILEFFVENKKLLNQMTTDAMELYKAFNTIMPTAEIAALKFIMTKKNVTEAEAFFHSLCNGFSLEAGDPIKRLRDRLTDIKIKKLPTRGPQRTGMIIKVWNMVRTGKVSNRIAWNRQTEEFPIVL